MPEPKPDGERNAILYAHEVTKVYKMGDVDVHALRGVTVPLYEGESSKMKGPTITPLPIVHHTVTFSWLSGCWMCS